MNRTLQSMLIALLLIMASPFATSGWDDRYVYYPSYYNSGWDNGSYWTDGRGYGRGNASGEGSFSFNISARGRADTEWDADYFSDYYGGRHTGYPFYPVPHAATTELKTIEPSTDQ